MSAKIYVVSLNDAARQDASYMSKMYQLLSSTSGVEILEGAGRKTTKVRMSSDMRHSLKRALPQLTFSVFEDLDLLSTR
jgi:hypothetical protein